jgi:hypothetical protein
MEGSQSIAWNVTPATFVAPATLTVVDLQPSGNPLYDMVVVEQNPPANQIVPKATVVDITIAPRAKAPIPLEAVADLSSEFVTGAKDKGLATVDKLVEAVKDAKISPIITEEKAYTAVTAAEKKKLEATFGASDEATFALLKTLGKTVR